MTTELSKALVLLDAEAILGIDDLHIETVYVPEWNGSVRVRTLTAKERDDFEQSLLEKRGRGKNQTREMTFLNMRSKLVVKCLMHPTENSRLFRDDQAEQLGRKSGAAVDRLYDVAARLAGISEEDVDELVGNSESDQPDSSPSN